MLEEIMQELREPFESVEWKPQAVKGDRALAVAYADTRAYQDRLNEVVGSDWSDEYEVLNDGAVVLCKLTVKGVTRSDIGEAKPNDPNTATSALAQAFKRACVKFGVGRYLYDLPKTWADYDSQRKRFTKRGMAQIQQALLNGMGEMLDDTIAKTKRSDNGKGGPTEFWRLYNECEGAVSRDQAQEWARAGDWAQAMDKLKVAIN